MTSSGYQPLQLDFWPVNAMGHLSPLLVAGLLPSHVPIFKGVQSGLNGLKSLAKLFNFVVF